MNRFVIIGITLLLSASLFSYASRMTPTPIHRGTQSNGTSQPNPTLIQPTPSVHPTQTVQPTPTVKPTQTSRPTPSATSLPTVTSLPTATPTPAAQTTPTVQPTQTPTPVVQNETLTVRNLVLDFGKKLQMVSLSAPRGLADRSIRENYSEFLSPSLLAKWRKDPQKALGRTVSSPWPDRIDIMAIEETAPDTYQVSGEIVEITSVEKLNGGIAAKRPVILVVKQNDGVANRRFWIDEVMAGSYVAPRSLSYINSRYGFYFSLPEDWKGYTIVMNTWEGLPIPDGSGDSKISESGPRLSIRHPQWTNQEPRQDIPIMIFTLAQWDALQHGKYHIGAAPIGPSELGRNNKYVFALPARYNYAFPTGFEEVEQILKGKPLQTLEIPN
ncbi:MAG TPA: hypothetical protein VHY08_19965 [Bacillota bacterium]|nr:hypothetical protein [Bacillota bacterium]